MKHLNRLLCCLVILLCSCKLKHEQSSTSHAEGDVFSDIPKIFWAPFSESSLNRIKSRFPDGVYDSNDEIVKYLDEKLNNFHQILTKKYPSIVAPAPKALLVKNFMPSGGIVNGFYVIPLKNSRWQGTNHPASLTIHPKEAKFVIYDRTRDFATENVNAQELMEALEFIGFKTEECFSLSNDQIELVSSCPYIDKEVSNISIDEVDSIEIPILHPYIEITDGAIRFFKEKELMAFISHELAHYYRAHSTVEMHKTDYFYFYEMDKRNNSTSKPIPSKNPELISLGKQIFQLLKEEKYQYSDSIEFDWLHPALINRLIVLADHPFIPNKLQETCATENCVQMCEKMFDKLRSISAPLSPHDSEDLQKSLESEGKSCVEGIAVTDSIDVSEFAQRIQGLKFKDSSKNLYELVKLRSQEIAEVDQNIKEILKKGYDLGLGYYTKEQEADEIGLEFSLQIGLSYEDALTHLFGLLEYKSSYSKKVPYEPTFDECVKEKNNGFKNFISPGRFVDSHHSLCFRIYNTYREYEAHKSYYKQFKNSGTYLENPEELKKFKNSIN